MINMRQRVENLARKSNTERGYGQQNFSHPATAPLRNRCRCFLPNNWNSSWLRRSSETFHGVCTCETIGCKIVKWSQQTGNFPTGPGLKLFRWRQTKFFHFNRTLPLLDELWIEIPASLLCPWSQSWPWQRQLGILLIKLEKRSFPKAHTSHPLCAAYKIGHVCFDAFSPWRDFLLMTTRPDSAQLSKFCPGHFWIR